MSLFMSLFWRLRSLSFDSIPLAKSRKLALISTALKASAMSAQAASVHTCILPKLASRSTAPQVSSVSAQAGATVSAPGAYAATIHTPTLTSLPSILTAPKPIAASTMTYSANNLQQLAAPNSDFFLITHINKISYPDLFKILYLSIRCLCYSEYGPRHGTLSPRSMF